MIKMKHTLGLSILLGLWPIWLLTTQGATAAGLDQPLLLQALASETPPGPSIVVPDQVNVRLGPGVKYDQVGILTTGQRAVAIGRSPGGDWIQIEYPGVPGGRAWVYAAYVILESTSTMLPVVEPPPTPEPEATATIDPTLAAQFNLDEPQATRLPTFTPAAAIPQPTFPPNQTAQTGRFPPILIILGFAVVGIFGLFISFLRGA